jgi:hypothetical protein
MSGNNRQMVFDALKSGPKRTAEIIVITQLDRGSVRRALESLMQDGLVNSRRIGQSSEYTVSLGASRPVDRRTLNVFPWQRALAA